MSQSHRFTREHLLRALYQRTLTAFEVGDTDDLELLTTTISTLAEIVERSPDKLLFTFLDDLTYILQEWAMEGHVDPIPALHLLEHQLLALEQHANDH